jgi:cytochrome c oxidase assembly protein subunit 15
MSRILPRLTFWNLLAQAGIIVTGVAVRATGSGLGCPTWPQCTPGSYTPTVEQAQSWHKFVEFGNRSLSFLLVGIAIATLVVVSRELRSDRLAIRLAWVPVLGTFAQAILGGITVRVGLNPYSVMAHFLLSLPLIAAAYFLWARITQPVRVVEAAPEHRGMARALLVTALVVLVLGTVTTGSGPHSGDAAEPLRLGLDPAIMSWVHAAAVALFAGLAFGLWSGARTRSAELSKAALGTLHIVGAQAVVGLAQFYFGLPSWMLIVHAGLAAWFWIAVLKVQANA